MSLSGKKGNKGNKGNKGDGPILPLPSGRGSGPIGLMPRNELLQYYFNDLPTPGR